MAKYPPPSPSPLTLPVANVKGVGKGYVGCGPSARAKPYIPNRPSKPGPMSALDVPDNRAAFLELIEKGASVGAAARVAGFNGKTIWRYIENNPEVAEAVAIARDKGKLDLIQKIHENPDWRAAAWKLQRMWPEEFGDKKLTEAETQEIVLRVKQITQVVLEQCNLPPNQVSDILGKIDAHLYPNQVTEVVVSFDATSTDTTPADDTSTTPTTTPVSKRKRKGATKCN